MSKYCAARVKFPLTREFYLSSDFVDARDDGETISMIENAL